MSLKEESKVTYTFFAFSKTKNGRQFFNKLDLSISTSPKWAALSTDRQPVQCDLDLLKKGEKSNKALHFIQLALTLTQCQSVGTFESEVRNSLSTLEPHSMDSMGHQHHAKKLSPKITLQFKSIVRK